MQKFEVREGDSRELIKALEDSSVDAIVTDPPYEIGFLGKGWDASGIAYDKDFWAECLRVLKPGGHLLAFSAPRTYHRMACAIEDAGFEIRDQIMWLHSEGMPKGQNLYLQGEKKGYGPECTAPLKGWNTTLKPCHEPLVMARKAVEGTILDNMVRHGVGGLHVDVCRVPVDWDTDPSSRAKGSGFWKKDYVLTSEILVPNCPQKQKYYDYDTTKGRFPANVVHDGSDEVLSYFPDTGAPCGSAPVNWVNSSDPRVSNSPSAKGKPGFRGVEQYVGDMGSAARFYYCPKPKAKERDAGLEDFEAKETWAQQNSFSSDPRMEAPQRRLPKKNTHVTVKPTKLMQWLVRLVVPAGALVLDPFTGSGSTGRACMFEDVRFLGFELQEEYAIIARARIEDALKDAEASDTPTLFDDGDDI
jgi:site-specific DNA-methyltransferase (adenine-specific)